MNKYLECIEKYKKMIEEYPLEITEGTKKMILDYKKKAALTRNEMIQVLKSAYTIDKNTLIKVLKEIKDKYYKETNSKVIDSSFKELKKFVRLIELNNPYNDPIDKIDLFKYINSIDDIENNDLKTINNTILYIIEIFKTANITLSIDDFNYTYYTNQYMKSFFENQNNENFIIQMNDIFDELYWNCPNLLTEIKLNFLFLINKYSKNIDALYKKEELELYEELRVSTDNYKKIYDEKYIKLEDLKNKDVFLNTSLFINETLNIQDYLENSPIRINKLEKFSKKSDFNSLIKEQKEQFYLNIIDLKNTIYEVENYHLYEKIIVDLKEKYNNKDSYKGILAKKIKEIKKVEKVRIKLNKKYNKIISKTKINENSKNVLDKKIKDQIELLNNLYNELENIRVDTKVSILIQEGFTIYDLLYFSQSFHNYLVNLVKEKYNINIPTEIENFISKLSDFLYNPNVEVIKKVNAFSDIDLESTLINKCKLFDINLTKEDLLSNLDNLKKDVDMIVKIYDVENSKTTFENIKYVCDINKI